MTDISIVIPTRNRPVLLGRCLASLCEQTMDAASFDICVADNGAPEQTQKVIALVTAHYPKHRIGMIAETARGVSAARNAGARQTSSPLIAQLDDDMIVAPDWLARLTAGFAQDDKIGKIGGPVAPIFAAPRPAWMTDDMLPLLVGGNGAGNACYRRGALAAAGYFPVSLGHKGNNLLAGENAVDRVMEAAGWKNLADNAIVAQHTIAAERVTPAWARRRAFWQGIAEHATEVYLHGKGIETGAAMENPLPLDRDDWLFINNADQPPTADALVRLRGLGRTLARSGFMPI